MVARVGSFLKWLAGREETVVAVVCHGIFIRVLFGEPTGRLPGKLEEIFEVAPPDVSRVTLKSGVKNCSVHAVTLVFPTTDRV